MASIHKRFNSPNWHGAFRQSGKLVFRSTGTPDRALATRIADEWQQLAIKADSGMLVESQARDVVADIVKRAGLNAPGVKPPPIGEYVKSWLDSKLADLAQGSAWSYEKATKSFLEFIGNRQTHPIVAIQPPDARAFVAHLQREKYAPKSVTVYLRVISAVFLQAVRDGLLSANPFAGAVGDGKGSTKSKSVHKREPFAAGEVRILIATAKEVSADWETAVMVGAYTGARLRDCCRLRWEDVDLTAGTLTFTPLKTGTEMVLPIHPALLAHLVAMASKTGDSAEAFVTPTLATLETGGRGGLSSQFARVMRRAGISAGKVSEGTRRKQNARGFHSLRHRCNASRDFVRGEADAG